MTGSMRPPGRIVRIHTQMSRPMTGVPSPMHVIGRVGGSSRHFVEIRRFYIIRFSLGGFIRSAGAATHGPCQLRFIANEEFMVVAVPIRSSRDAFEAPAIDLTHEGRVFALMGKILGSYLFAKECRLEHAPRAAVWHPGDDVRVFWIGKDFEELGWKGRTGRWSPSTTGIIGCSRTHSKWVIIHVDRLQH